jgi:hypothetical protein
VLDTPAVRPVRFELATQWQASTQTFREERQHYLAVLRVERRSADWLKTWQGAEVLEEGERPLVRVDFHCEEEAAFVVLGLGGRAETVNPEGLRERVRKEVVGLAKAYRISHHIA